MTATANTGRLIRLAVTTTLASATLASCVGKVAPAAQVSSEAAKASLARGKGDKAVAYAEAAVLAMPRDGETRALLAAAYLEAGRFDSAATAFGDAMQLGDTSGTTVLKYALTLSATGRFAEAQTLLARYQRNLDPADYGLAITLAGSPQQGIEALSDALKYGQNGPKVRQNLAYAFALKGDWRSARLLAAQDLTPDKLDDRLGEWAQMAMPEMQMHRVAALLGVSIKADSGQPAQLALINFPTNEQLAAETEAGPAIPEDGTAMAANAAELPAGEAPAPASPAEPAFARYEPGSELAPVAVSSTPAAPRIVLPRATPAPAPVRTAAAPLAKKPVPAKPSPAFAAAFVRQPGNYQVQLGSFVSMSGASAAWARYQQRHPELKGADRVITKAVVNGKTYYRVAAGGFARTSATSFCSAVKKGGGGCLAFASSPTRPGSAKAETRVATR